MAVNTKNLRGADLRGQVLSGADLSGADLRRADLSGADLRRADLRRADLSGAVLGGANLIGADLRRADLRRANLRRADLRMADLSRAHLIGADLTSTSLPAPTEVLLAAWGTLSPSLTADLMAFDASCHPNPKAFETWVETGKCPYSKCRVQRAANFNERRDLYDPKRVAPRPYDLMFRVLMEAGCLPEGRL